MGVELVKLLAAHHAARLSQRALVVLLHMSLHALDQPNTKGQPARLYFAGWQALALALGYDEPTRAAQESVRRAIKELREAGLVEPVAGHARTGRRQSYRLHLSLSGAHESPSDSVGLSPTDSEGQEPHRFGGDSPTESEGPRKELGGTEDSLQDYIQPVPAPTTVRARADHEHVDWKRQHLWMPDDSGEYCEGCGLPETHFRHYLGNIA